MLENMKFKSANNSGSLLAAYFILSLGLFVAMFFAGVAFQHMPEVPVYVLAIGGVTVLLTLLLRLRPDLPSACFWLFTHGRGQAEPDYVPRLIKDAPKTFGDKRPPTVEELRELKENPRNWVPSKSRAARQSLRTSD